MTETTDVNLTITGTVESLHLEPGDRIIATLTDSPHLEHADKIRRQVREAFPGHEVIVLSEGIRLSRETAA